MYLESAQIIYHSNVLGDHLQSAHPTQIKLPNGNLVDVSKDVRDSVLERDYSEYGYYGSPIKRASKYHKICDEVEFNVYKDWSFDANTSGSRIRWRVPKGSELIFD